MDLVIYADVLLAVNLYINYFLLRGTSLLLRRKLAPLRCLCAAAVGAAFSLALMLPELHPALSVLIKLAAGVLVTLTAFGVQKRIDFLLSALCFLAVSFAFAGGMAALWSFAAPLGMYCNNGCVYFDIPIGAAAVITAALYGGFRLARLIIDRRKPALRETVTIRAGGKEAVLDGLGDTGNCLRDSFSGKPVIIASAEKLREILPQNVLSYLSGKSDGLDGIRLVPCSTVTSEGVIPVFPAEVLVGGAPVEALVGVSRQKLPGADCIFDPGIIPLKCDRLNDPARNIIQNQEVKP